MTYHTTDAADPATALLNALQDVTLGRVRPIEDVIREAKQEIHQQCSNTPAPGE